MSCGELYYKDRDGEMRDLYGSKWPPVTYVHKTFVCETPGRKADCDLRR